jgi:hypothetical protein
VIADYNGLEVDQVAADALSSWRAFLARGELHEAVRAA